MQIKHRKNLNPERSELGTTLNKPNWSIDICHAVAMLVREHRFLTSSLEAICMGTRSWGQNKSFRSLGTQYGRHVIKAYDVRF